MNKKKTARPAASAPTKADTPKKRSKLGLALAALGTLALAGGAFAGWTFYAGAAPGGPDAMHVAAVSPEIAAETSFTHSFALSVLMAPLCGPARVPGLRAVSGSEADADGRLVNLSWLAAARRAGDLTGLSCDHLRQEVREAEYRAVKLLQAKGETVEKH